jgi:cell division protein ZipA
MNDLRLFLLIIGITVIAGIYIWGTLNARKKQRQQTVQQRSSADDIANLKIANVNETGIDYSSVLAGLNQSISETKDQQIESMVAANVEDKDTFSEQQLDKKHEDVSSVEKSSSADNEHETRDELIEGIVILHIIPRGDELISGQAILNAVSEVDLQFGAMNIFHHFGVGEMKTEQALFSMANIMEPGSFDMSQIESFNTNGLVMFMKLPTLIDAQIVFELMLNTAQRLSDLLGGDVCDENRGLINEQKIESIRNRITV